MQEPSGDTVLDGMVVPGLSSSLIHHQDDYSSIPEGPCSSKASMVQCVQGKTGNSATILVATDAHPGKEMNGTCMNMNSHGFLEYGDIDEGPKTEMEGFIMRENAIDVIQEPVVAEIDSFNKRGSDDYNNLEPLVPTDQAHNAIANDNFTLQKSRVQWSDNNGMELFQVHEYEASDTGDSEDDDDDADSHVCTCTIQ